MEERAAQERLEGKALNFWQKVTYSLGNVGTNLAPGLVVGWMIYYYTGRPVSEGSEQTIMLVGAGTIAFLNFLGRLVDSLADPLVGYLSDRWQTPWGRRIPWVVIGSPLLSAFLIMMWFPPDDHPTLANAIWLGVALSGIWFFYTAVVAPYLSLLPEITPFINERVVLSTYMSYADVIGMILASVVAGALFERFSGGLTIGPIVLSDGYKVGGVIISIMMLFFFWVSVTLVRERPQHEIKPVKFNFITAAKECAKNPAFWPYIITVSLLRLGIDVLVAMIPFLVVRVMGFGEAMAGGLQAVIILIAAIFFPLTAHLANKYGKKKIFSIALLWFAVQVPFLALVVHAPFVGYVVAAVAKLFGVSMTYQQIMLAHCFGLFILMFFPVSAAFVLPRPIYADIMDYDEKLTGYRREAMYNGMEGLITKFAAGVAGAMVPLMVKYMGGTASSPWGILASGPRCGLFLFFGWLAFRKHPFDY
ncbi:MAG TPA: MFS transporter [Proteobacteria bacterium]|nr:MFS transporter [Pseudomonadota bacterium]